MNMARWLLWLSAGSLVVSACLLPAAESTPQERRTMARQQFDQGNVKDAFDAWRPLLVAAETPARQVAEDLPLAVQSLLRLGRLDEIDPLLEEMAKVHAKQSRVLSAVGQQFRDTQHYGQIVAGEWSRGDRRGGGRFVNSLERDRVRTLQLYVAALVGQDAPLPPLERSNLLIDLANQLQTGGEGRNSWRLLVLTDLTTLPDFEEGWYGYRGQGVAQKGAPVEADGKTPVYHRLPASWDEAKTDGERWRWCLAQVAKIEPTRAREVDWLLAEFWHEQFGVQTLAQFGIQAPTGEDGDESGTFALSGLKDSETIARLATGVKRWTLPEEFNPIAIWTRLAEAKGQPYAEYALDRLVGVYEDRRQYVRAEETLKRLIAEYGPGPDNSRLIRLDQLAGQWGRFEGGRPQAAGEKTTLEYRFRNGTRVDLEARAILVDQLLSDAKAYLKSNPKQIDWQKLNVADIGYRLVEQNESKYLGAKVAEWGVDLKPRPGHVDDRITLDVPVKAAGAYLVTAKMKGGNTSRVIVWVADTVIVRKPLSEASWYLVADALTGAPVAKANVEFFGWKQEQVKPETNLYKVVTTNFAQFASADGDLSVSHNRLKTDQNWVVIARTPQGRLAYHGFNGVWANGYYDAEYNETKLFTITDRPVYRPEQTVQWKFWLGTAKYDQPAEKSPFAGQSFQVEIHDPQGTKVHEQAVTADIYGGMAGEYELPKLAKLGVYRVSVVDRGGGSFRVEEYKKPEFEVTVESPTEPVKLGEKITGKIVAKYYFGGPVTNARVKYKVTRANHDSTWYPAGRWDWFYGRGYWWFASDSSWYPGWSSWGCARPIGWWWGRPEPQPEVVMENEVAIGADGTVSVEIDTLPAKELYGTSDHRYTLSAEVVDASRRTIVGEGNVLVAREPFRVFAWTDRGHFQTGDVVEARFQSQTLDQKPVIGKGTLALFKIGYVKDGQPVDTPIETKVESWEPVINAQGEAAQKFNVVESGQYRVSFKVTDSKGHTQEGGYLFTVRGAGFDGKSVRYNDLELIVEKREYAPDEKVQLLVNTDRADSLVALFLRPANGTYLPPQMLKIAGKSRLVELPVTQKDMPNFFIEALTVSNANVYSETREIVVPPEQRVFNVEVTTDQSEYRPGSEAKVTLKLTDNDGKPYVGSTVISMYDRSVEYISGGSNVAEIREFFWKWRRQHHPHSESSLDRFFGNLLKGGERGMGDLGVFGASVVEEETRALALSDRRDGAQRKAGAARGRAMFGAEMAGGMGGAVPQSAVMSAPAPAGAMAELSMDAAAPMAKNAMGAADKEAGGPPVPPTVRTNFADTAFWASAVETNAEGVATVSLTMPENLTGWKVKVWAMGLGTRVGEGTAEVTTKKNLLVRLQAPRFFTQTDEVVLSNIIMNSLKTGKSVQSVLEIDELDGARVELMGGEAKRDPADARATKVPGWSTTTGLELAAGSEARTDWRIRVLEPGRIVVRMKGLTDEESDAMEMTFPVYVHGMLKMDSFAGVVRPGDESQSVTIKVPAERRVADSRIEVRFSPTLAGAMVDALPYMVDYPYGCTEQTLNRFLPTVITQRILQKMQVNLKDVVNKRTNLNAQELGDDRERAEQWKRFDRNPVFDEAEVANMVTTGVDRLTNMQLSDGGWGWFSGYGEHSSAHTTAVVVHGLQVAMANDVAIVPEVLARGVEWLKQHQTEQVRLLKNAATKTDPWKSQADAIDALVYYVLTDSDVADAEMLDFLYRDRTTLPVYAQAMFGIALDKQQQADKLAVVLQNIKQFVVEDAENETAYLRLPESNSWWTWYGSEVEANAFYLKLLARVDAKGPLASRLVKYLLNNRKHATYWASTRDTGYAIEAMADFLKASGEDEPEMTVEVWLNGEKKKEVQIDKSNLFTFDNKFVLFGEAVPAGEHKLELRRKGKGPVYFNAYVTNFSLEDFLTKAGLEVKVQRKVYRLKPVDKQVAAAGTRGQVTTQKVEKYERELLENDAKLISGELVEIEFEIDSKNDYEYLCFEDFKGAGFEPVDVRSGYTGQGLGAYVEYRDEKACFFVRSLPHGKHSLSYRLRAEVPGRFSALPTIGYAMYAPELKGNSDEIKLQIEDRPVK
jgi:alpha-2-macroglobulin